MHAAEYVVSPDGNDSNTGDASAPFRTISQAARILKPGDTCLIRCGTYRETIRPANSGTPDAPIVFRNWPGERSTILGTDPVADWIKDTANSWKASMNWDMGQHNQVFINDTPGFEARWPSKTNNDPLDWEAVPYDKGSNNKLIACKHLPEAPEDYWKGAVVWALAGRKWTTWSAIVTGNKAGERQIHLGPLPKQGSIANNMSPAHRDGGVFYISGIKSQMNTPNEWYLDTETKTLYLCLKPEQDPAKMRIEAKRRDWAFDLNQRDYIHVEGLKIQGASIRLEESNHCLLKDLRMYWIAHIRGGNTGYNTNDKLGILIDGHHNTIRDSEIAYSVGNGIAINGYRNNVINCWIHHINYSGSYDAPIKARGWEMLISHNTIHDAGRDCIRPFGQAHIVQYNDLFNMGRICHDLGATYVNSADGGGTEYRYNWVHDNLARGHQMGIYLDNFCSFHLVHHNVTWNNAWADIMLNKPSLFNVVINNTMLGKSSRWGRWKADWMYGSAYINNMVGESIKSHPQLVMKNNISGKHVGHLNHKNLHKFIEGTDKGIAVPGITGGKSYVGAYPPGKSWKPGHDFVNPPNPEYELSDTPLRNLVRHGSFDWIQYEKTLGPWIPTGARSAEVINGKGNILLSYKERNSIIGNSVQLKGKAPDGISQEIIGLRPNRKYEAGAWVKTESDATVTLSVAGLSEEMVITESMKSARWQYMRIHFATGENVDKATLSFTKNAPGTVFIDDISLVGLLPGIHPVKPGVAQ